MGVTYPLHSADYEPLHDDASVRISAAPWLAAASLLCAVLAAFNIERASLWTDELFSRYYYDLFGLRYLLGAGLTVEPTPPTFPILLKLWMEVFGTSTAALRGMSALAYVACLPFVYMLGRELCGRRSGIVAAFLFAVSPTGLYFAKEARVYAVNLLPLCLLLWSMAVLLRNPYSRRATLAYVLGGTACLYLHASMLLVVTACAACGGVWTLVGSEPGRAHRVLRWVALNLGVGILSLPYTHNLLSAAHAGGLEWMPPLSIRLIASVLTSFFNGMLTPHPLPGGAVAVAVVAGLVAAVAARPPPGRIWAVTIAVPVLFFVLVCGVSLARPMLIGRILCWAVVPFCVLAGRQIAAGGRMAFVLGGTLLLASMVGLFYNETTPYGGKEPWKQAFADIEPRAAAGDLLVISPSSNALIPLRYAPEMRNLRIWSAGLPDTIMTPAHRRLHVLPITTTALQEQIASGRTVWLMSNGFDTSYADLIKARMPAQYDRAWPCGRTTCVSITGWSMAGRGQPPG